MFVNDEKPSGAIMGATEAGALRCLTRDQYLSTDKVCATCSIDACHRGHKN